VYLLILLLFPFLFLFNTYLATAGLLAIIVFLYVERTRPSKPWTPRPRERAYKAGYEE
jgi:hypothetical protein